MSLLLLLLLFQEKAQCIHAHQLALSAAVSII
jgi:hypothetical protein